MIIIKEYVQEIIQRKKRRKHLTVIKEDEHFVSKKKQASDLGKSQIIANMLELPNDHQVPESDISLLILVYR
jgi:hypothetical protein